MYLSQLFAFLRMVRAGRSLAGTLKDPKEGIPQGQMEELARDWKPLTKAQRTEEWIALAMVGVMVGWIPASVAFFGFPVWGIQVWIGWKLLWFAWSVTNCAFARMKNRGGMGAMVASFFLSPLLVFIYLLAVPTSLPSWSVAPGVPYGNLAAHEDQVRCEMRARKFVPIFLLVLVCCLAVCIWATLHGWP